MSAGDANLVKAHTSAARRWWRESDMPDPLGYQDVSGRPDLVAAVLDGRRSDGRAVRSARPFTYPKPSTGTRTMVRLDPYTDLLYRERVGSVVRQIERHLTGGVRHTRCEFTGRTWAAHDHREADKQFRADLKRLRREHPATELGLDIKSHFPTVAIDDLHNRLSDAGASDAQIERIAAVVNEIDGVAGVPGLPIGPEGSAPLGTVALATVDQLIDRLGYEMIRWMDDIAIRGVAPGDKDAVEAAVEAELAALGQTLNSDKTTYDDVDEVVDRERSTDDGAPGPAAIFDGDPIAWLNEAAVDGATGNVKFVLGGLRKREDPDALEVLRDHPWIMERFPKHAGSYIRAVRDESPSRVEWIQDYLAEPVTASTAPAHLHLVRSLTPELLPARLGALLFERGAQLTGTQHSCLADHLLAAGSRSAEKVGTRRIRALEFAREDGPLDGRRAALAAFQRGGIPKPGMDGLAAIARSEHELIPTIEYVKAS